jgi:hypothetical protein
MELKAALNSSNLASSPIPTLPPASWSRSRARSSPGQDGRIYIELVNAPFLKAGGNAAEYWAGMDRAIAKGWLMF